MVISDPDEMASIISEISGMKMNNRPSFSVEIELRDKSRLLFERARLCEGIMLKESAKVYPIAFYPDEILDEELAAEYGLTVHNTLDDQYFVTSLQNWPKIVKLYVHWI